MACRRAGWWLAVALATVALGPGAAGAAEETGLDPKMLALCKSSDLTARRFCLETIEKNGDPRGDALRILAEMAAHDEQLHQLAAALYQRLYGTAPPPFAAAGAPAKGDPSKGYGDPMRVVFAPTAFTRPEGTTSFNAFELGTLTFDHGFSPNVSAGLQTAIPIGALVVGPTIKVAYPFEGGAFGVYLNALAIVPFVGNSRPVLVAGGGPMLTIGNYERYFNVGVLAFVASQGKTEALVVPHAGFSIRVSDHVRLGIEGYLPGVTGDASNSFGKLGLVMWGVRLFGDTLWGDIALVDPFCDGCGALYKTLPLGIPFLNFGLAW